MIRTRMEQSESKEAPEAKVSSDLLIDGPRIEGYDEDDLVNKCVKVDHFVCAICHNIARNPKGCPSEHLFCEDCLVGWGRNTCPTCRVVVEKPIGIDHSRYVKEDYLSMTTKCRFHGRGCDKVLHLGPEIEKHEMECGHAYMHCSYGCEVRNLKRAEYENHQKECLHRPFSCECGVTIMFKDRGSHNRTCPKFEIRCNECQATMKREALAAHKSVNGNCPKTRIPCPIEGCRWHGKREDFHAHERSAALEHVRLLHKAAEEKNADMLKKMSEMQKAFDAMSTELACLRDSHALMESVAFPPFKIEGATYMTEVNGTYFVDLSKGRVNGKPVWKRRCARNALVPEREWFVFYNSSSSWMITPLEHGVKESKGCFHSKDQNLDFPFEAKGWKRYMYESQKWADDSDIKITETGVSDASAGTD